MLDRQTVYVYAGAWEKAKAADSIVLSSYRVENGVGNFIRQKQQGLAQKGEKDDLMVAIKPVSTASYQDVINALDEMHLNDVKRYGILQITEAEQAFLLSQKQ